MMGGGLLSSQNVETHRGKGAALDIVDDTLQVFTKFEDTKNLECLCRSSQNATERALH